MNVDYILYKNGFVARFEVDIARRLKVAGVIVAANRLLCHDSMQNGTWSFSAESPPYRTVTGRA